MTFARSLLLLLVACTWSPASGSVPHHGCYLDKNHYAGPTSWAGLRFIAEGPPHTLKMVGSDDGVKWWTLVGTCSGSKMEKITFDFSSKGGPAALVGTAKVLADGTAQIIWPDGNAWTRLESPPLPAIGTSLRAEVVARHSSSATLAWAVVLGATTLAGAFAALRYRQRGTEFTLSVPQDEV